MKVLFALLMALGVWIMALGHFQRFAEIARWTQIYGVLTSSNPGLILPNETQAAVDKAFASDTSPYNATSLCGILVFIFSGTGLVVSLRKKDKAKSPS